MLFLTVMADTAVKPLGLRPHWHNVATHMRPLPSRKETSTQTNEAYCRQVERVIYSHHDMRSSSRLLAYSHV